MRILIRADASVAMGSGHIMRCLTLADRLRAEGASVSFLSRCFPGELSALVRSRGHEALMLTAPEQEYQANPNDLKHAAWLGVSWQEDLQEAKSTLGAHKYDWLIVDHYALDYRWESSMRAHAEQIFVIDDLADRTHDCDLLLDQTFGRQESCYASLVPESCEQLLGSDYALLRPEFLSLRERAFKRRASFNQIETVLVAMGGADPDNVTQKALHGLAQINWAVKPRIQVVLGSQAPHWQQIRRLAANTDLEIEVHRGVSNMAEFMYSADLALGASGTTSWERCCLGLPSLVTVTAENQNDISAHLEKQGAIIGLGFHESWREDDLEKKITELRDTPGLYQKMVEAMKAVCPGNGTQLVVSRMKQIRVKT